ncbi:uncharacterized protein PHACADRAFT_152721 [Phanerochaete carnosa HHB-10118-sp]|uniref:Pericentrin/AKAP-450 centrosomal targeting domain-containing protein n=1 Tax=Phanerochaete carnosa (strain HHB-10118-sp) TaxID=650164 RepID=K5VHA1_PHACS|nr:uncharacterized protein PHACADRAFT_152721 [Phanerochaete carnosa HHB-10118-sp]EKM50608.1 hypothetical protein PHACADRAFT_152721 [Phanerochaete carnosa HHB-10118-sp]
MGAILETPSRVWRRIQDIEGQEMPSLPSIPVMEDLTEMHSETTDDLDASRMSNPITSTPAAFSSHHNTVSTIKPSLTLGTGSTARFANSIESRSSKSMTGMSASGSKSGLSKQQLVKQQPQQYSFDMSMIPSLPQPHDDMEIRSSDQDTHDSVADAYFPPADAGAEDDFNISEALQSVSRSGSPSQVGTQGEFFLQLWDRSSKTSIFQPSPFDKLRNVSLRRPLSRNTRTPSLTRTNTPSPSSSTSNSTPHDTQSLPSNPVSPIPAPSAPLPRSNTASPMLARQASASAMPARFIPLPPSTNTSPVTAIPLRQRAYEQATDNEIASPSRSLPQAEFTQITEAHTEQASSVAETDEREPTFSSEEGPTPFGRSASHGPNQFQQSRASPVISVAFSSPAPSAMFTPTPAFPRPRARFQLPPARPPTSTTPPDPLSSSEQGGTHEDQDEATWRAGDHREDPATPNAHKRSFLLSVINSTARPRLKHPTPHPHHHPTPHPHHVGNDVPETPAAALPAAFAGITPGLHAHLSMHSRFSHPLAQIWTAQAQSDSGSEEVQAQSPVGYDGGLDRASFISTASSQDLTTHARANASFDPVIGLGERGHGVGRFNAGKLNNYLHGLNRKLQEENEQLVVQLRAYEEKHGASDATGTEVSPGSSAASARRRQSGGGRRISAGPLGLGAVVEDAWVEEKAQMEELVEKMEEELERIGHEKADTERALEEERDERMRDKERFKQRMTEVEQGVQEIVEDLDKKLHDAEQRAETADKNKGQMIRDVERRLAEVIVERDVLVERVEQAENALKSGKDLGAELNAANERVAKVLGDLKNANLLIKRLEEEAGRADERMDAMEKELAEEKKLVVELEEELQVKSDELSQTLQRLESLQDDVDSARHEVQQHKAFAAQLEGDANAAVERVATLQQQLAATRDKLETVTAILDQEQEKSSKFEAEAERTAELARELEEALDAAEHKIRDDEEQINGLKIKVSGLERELDRSRSRNEASKLQAVPDPEMQAEIDVLEAELDGAHKEIARLNMLVSQSPARKAMERAKNSRIEMLEQERDDLLERLKAMKVNSANVSASGKMSANGISPFHRAVLNMTMKSPKTPGGPLRDLSWLQTTVHDATAAPLVAEIERLQQELERANEDIDEKIDRLEDAGLGVVSLTKQLEDARERIHALEDEVGRLSRREERRVQRLEKLRCQKCRVKVDTLSLQMRSADESSLVDPRDIEEVSEPPTPPTKTSEKLRADLKAVTEQLANMKQQWDGERRKLLGENASLKDTTNRLNLEVRQAKSDMRRLADTDRTKASTQGDMADIRQELQRIKQENQELEGELRANSNVEQKARLLESKVAENIETIEQLRRERSLLVADHKKLQKQFGQASENVNQLRKSHATSQTSHDKRRHALDLHLLEIEDLRRAISAQTGELQRAEAETQRAASERGDLARTVAALETDLRRVRRDAEAFGRDLRELRAQKDKLEAERRDATARAERAQKQAQTQIRVLKEEVQEQRERARAARDEWKRHVCADAVDNEQVVALKAQHKNECKGLIVQIKYLKAKWTRESGLRSDLGYQKQYLLVLLARCERNEQKILAAIAKTGFPGTLPHTSAKSTRKGRKLKTVVHSIVFALRAKHASDAWRLECSAKQAIAAALQDVRKAREERAKASA